MSARLLLVILVLGAGCGPRPDTVAPPATTPAATSEVQAAATPTALPKPASPTAPLAPTNGSAPTSSVLADALATTAASTPRPTSSPVPLALERITVLPQSCLEPRLGLPAEGLREVAHLPTGFCFHGEIGLFETGSRLYSVQALADQAGYVAFVIADVSDPTQPALVGAWQWTVPTYTADVKPFRQGDRHFLALARQGPNGMDLERLCDRGAGVALVEVTDPEAPVLLEVLTGLGVASRDTWCNVHTVEVSTDEVGNGAFLYMSATDTFDLRVVDIRDLANPREISHYTHPDAGFYNPRNEFFVHDSTIVADRVYVSYWSAGVIILDRARMEAGRVGQPLNPLDSIDPWGFQAHHAFPIHNGDYLFIEDEVHYGDRPLIRLYDIRELSDPREVAAIALEAALGAPHNLLVEGDRLFVGWYQDGVRVFDLDASDPDHPVVIPGPFLAVRNVRTANYEFGDSFDGIWGLRLHDCVIDDLPRTCLYASDITYGLRILVLEP